MVIVSLIHTDPSVLLTTFSKCLFKEFLIRFLKVQLYEEGSWLLLYKMNENSADKAYSEFIVMIVFIVAMLTSILQCKHTFTFMVRHCCSLANLCQCN